MFFQSVTSLSVIPAKLVLDSDRGAGIQELVDNWSIPNKRNKRFALLTIDVNNNILLLRLSNCNYRVIV